MMQQENKIVRLAMSKRDGERGHYDCARIAFSDNGARDTTSIPSRDRVRQCLYHHRFPDASLTSATASISDGESDLETRPFSRSRTRMGTREMTLRITSLKMTFGDRTREERVSELDGDFVCAKVCMMSPICFK